MKVEDLPELAAPVVVAQAPGEPVVEVPVNEAMAKRQEELNTFVSRSMHILSKNDVAVWLALFHASDVEFKTTIGRTKLADRVGVSPSTISLTLERLEQAGLITVMYQGGIGRGSSRYRVHGKKKLTLHWK